MGIGTLLQIYLNNVVDQNVTSMKRQVCGESRSHPELTIGTRNVAGRGQNKPLHGPGRCSVASLIARGAGVIIDDPLD